MRKRIAVIDREKCHPEECGDYLCAKLCPVNRSGGDCVFPGEDQGKKARIDEMLCTGCQICSNRCPFKAIEIINLPETLNKPPVHRYGQNMFELYSLPTPLFGQVTGIVGRNGLGKSTAFKIMANLLKPNLGKWQDPVEFKDVINYFKGTETQKFLEQLQENKITLSFKPQQVDLIPKQFQGTVRELLTKINADDLGKIAKDLNLLNFLDTDISKISGGELQRVAIAAAVLKGGNLLLFDELTSFLDIKQRLNVAKFVRSLVEPETAVMVVEHDLVALDYMADSVNIMYGYPAGYGIVSGIKAAKKGINSYLSGYLKEENIRFRNHPIKFEVIAPSKEFKREVLINWTDMKKKLGNFDLKVGKGSIFKNEVVGVLGENGIGKTTLIRIFAGLIKPDFGEINQKLNVSYKPQQIFTDSEELVATFLTEALQDYEHQLITPLNIAPLLTKNLSQLSGGELQKVFIAKCLSQECDLALMDEPSAYLDVEQRLSLYRIISEVATAREISVIIVDHDLVFLDSISERLLVFEGKPAKEGLSKGPFSMEEGMNLFLRDLGITLRRDEESHRPRTNKLGSVKDREQKEKGNFYYS